MQSSQRLAQILQRFGDDEERHRPEVFRLEQGIVTEGGRRRLQDRVGKAVAGTGDDSSRQSAPVTPSCTAVRATALFRPSLDLRVEQHTRLRRSHARCDLGDESLASAPSITKISPGLVQNWPEPIVSDPTNPSARAAARVASAPGRITSGIDAAHLGIDRNRNRTGGGGIKDGSAGAQRTGEADGRDRRMGHQALADINRITLKQREEPVGKRQRVQWHDRWPAQTARRWPDGRGEP